MFSKGLCYLGEKKDTPNPVQVFLEVYRKIIFVYTGLESLYYEAELKNEKIIYN